MRRAAGLLVATLCSAALLVAPSTEAGAQGRAPADRLPYGVPVPPDQEVTRPPEPYDRARHGPPEPNTQPGANQVGRPGVQLPERARPPRQPRRGPPPPGSAERVPGSGDRGLWILTGNGVQAGSDAQLDLAIPANAIGTTIYAPTHMAAGHTCIETVTAHYRYTGMARTAHAHGFWDWCETDGSGGWQVFEFMDASWQQKYVRQSNGEGRYWTEVHQDGSCWWGMLHNFNLGRWEAKAHICGTSPYGYSYGWTMWESHHLMDRARVCPSFPDITASDLLVLSGGNWVRLNGSTSGQLGPYGLCWENSTYRFTTSTGLDRWQALTSVRRR